MNEETTSNFPEEILATVRGKYPDIYELSAGGENVIVRAPTRPEYQRFRVTSLDRDKRSNAIEQLFRDCVCYPDKVAIGTMLDRKPALADVFGAKILEIAGASEEATSVKR